MTEFFADTSAILAFLNGDAAAGARFRQASFRTGMLNLYAAHLAQMAADVAPDEVRHNLSPFEPVALAPDPTVLREAARFLGEARREGRRLSPIDAVGYAQARRLGLPFLTTDGRFDGLPGVEPLRGRAKGR